jgi:hypothetical protein
MTTQATVSFRLFPPQGEWQEKSVFLIYRSRSGLLCCCYRLFWWILFFRMFEVIIVKMPPKKNGTDVFL